MNLLKNLLAILPLAMLLASCAQQNDPKIVSNNVLVAPQVDPSLLEVRDQPTREIRALSDGGLDDLGLYIVDLEQWGEDGWQQVADIGHTLSQFSARILRQNCVRDPELTGCGKIPKVPP